MFEYMRIMKIMPNLDENSDIYEILEKDRVTHIENERYEKAIAIKAILDFFDNLDSHELRLKDTLSYADKIKEVTNILNDEFEVRREHHKYQIMVQESLREIEYMMNSTIRMTDAVAKDMEEANCRVILKKCKENGIISTLKPQDGDHDTEKSKVKTGLESRQHFPFGMYRSEDLIKSKTLKSFILHDRVINKIVSNLKYYIFDNDAGGFFVTVVYLENSWRNLLVRCGNWFTNEVGLDEFDVPKEKFLEMQRTKNYKAEVTFGYSTFYVGRFVEILEEVNCKYVNKKIKALLGIGEDDDNKQEKE